MYYLFCNHNWPPSVYFDAHESDKRVIRAFAEEEAAHYLEMRNRMEG
jgi:hypothetical protein